MREGKYKPHVLTSIVPGFGWGFSYIHGRVTQQNSRNIMLRTASPGMSQTQGDARYSQMPSTQSASPTSGQTVSFQNTSLDQNLVLSPGGVLASLTINLPTDATSRLGQICRIVCTQAITLLTLGGATILNAPSSLAGNGCIMFIKVDVNTWAR